MLMKLLIACVAIVVCTVKLAAFPANFSFKPDGSIRVDGIKGYLAVYDKNGNKTTQASKTIIPRPAYPILSVKSSEAQGDWVVYPGKEPFWYLCKFREVSPEAVSYLGLFLCKDGKDVKRICFTLDLPVKDFKRNKLEVGKETLELNPDNSLNYEFNDVKSIRLRRAGKIVSILGKISGRVIFAADRGMYQLELYSSDSCGMVYKSAIKFEMKIRPTVQQELNLAKASAGVMTKKEKAKFHAAVGLRRSKYGFKRSGIDFKGGSAIRVAGNRVELPLKKNLTAGSYLYLLHHVGKNGNPELTMSAKDKGGQAYNLKKGVDFDTVIPAPEMKNAALVTAGKGATKSGLFLSKFQVERNVDKLTFNCKNGDWCIAGVAVASASVPIEEVDSIHLVVPGKEWVEMKKLPRVKAGSVLDFSRFLDAPAGKYGRVKANKEGHFCFSDKPGKRIRFWGTNLCFSANFLDNKDAETLADELAAIGYNSVRFHHFDNNLVRKGAKVSTELDPEQLDKLDYLFYCLKKRGLYITIDLYCSRIIKPGEFEEYPDIKGRALKLLSLIYPKGRDNWKNFARQILSRKNKYTGMTWAEDPALISVVLVNEASGFSAYDRYLKKKNAYTPVLKKAYQEWVDKNGLKTKPGDYSLFPRFITEKHIELIDDYRQFLRKIGYNGLITDLNHKNYMITKQVRDKLDYGDMHNYWDHPMFQPRSVWSFPYLHNQTSLLKYDAWTLRRVFASRIFGKPYTLSELNSCFPNRHRAEFGPLIGAYGSLQDIDGMYRFAWGHSKEDACHQKPIMRFDSAQDGLVHLSERIVNLMFLRGDVAGSKGGIGWEFKPGNFDGLNKHQSQSLAEHPVKYQQLCFYTKVGGLKAGKAFPGVTAIPENAGYHFEKYLPEKARKFLQQTKRVSDTGQITFDTENHNFKVVTPKTESLTLMNGNLAGKVLKVKNADAFQVVTASALDGYDLKDSNEILLIHQSNVTNKNIRYSSRHMNAVENWGEIIPMIKKSRVTVNLQLPKKNYVVQAIGMDGVPKAKMKASYRNGTLSFTADTSAFGGTMVYLIKH